MPNKTADSQIPDIVVSRLPVYLRTLRTMAAEGHAITSSTELAAKLGLTSAQIRKDLSYFGEFGKQGLGYNVSFLIEQLRRILHVEKIWDVVLVGAGDLGSALAHYHGFQDRGFAICMVFDSDNAKIGKRMADFVIRDMQHLVEEVRARHIQIAMLAVPATAAQKVADMLVQSGVKAILNYAPMSITTPKGIHVQNIDPAVHLQRMSFYLD